MHDTINDINRNAVVILADTGEYDAERSLTELAMLCETAGISVVGEMVQKLDAIDRTTYLGSGKLVECKELCEQLDADLIIADAELSSVQLKNIEDVCDTAVIDRTMLILDIFARNATTAEGKLQVEIAQQKYRLPRLTGAGKAMSRLGGGIGTRGPGETKLETDRRHIRERIKYLEDRLSDMSKQRETTRRRREREGVPFVSIVGYTNVGKSSLLNRLTDSDVLAENKLFATLDTTVRKLSIEDFREVLMCDTVGFVSRLPHHLVEAFKSTLNEIVHSDLIVRVLDASDPEWRVQLDITTDIIAQLGCAETPAITVFNKCDLAPDISLPYPAVSAKTGEGLERLVSDIAESLRHRSVRTRVLIPFTAMDVAAEIRRRGSILTEEYTDKGLLADISVPQNYYATIEKYAVVTAEKTD